MSAQIAIPHDAITAFCQRHRIRRLSLFGSVLRDDFQPDSDIDVLVEFEPGAQHTLTDLLTMQDQLAEILRRNVDLGERRSVEQDPNYIRRRHILESAQVVYEQG